MWAPDIQLVNGKYIVYFSGRQIGTEKLVIGAAVSTTDSALGPYQDIGQPLLQNKAFAWADTIDAHHFTDIDGTTYLLWKTQGDIFYQSSDILIRKINHDGISFDENEPETRILTTTLGWERAIAEGPWLLFRKGYYYLFYSGDVFWSNGYSVGIARSKKVTGPYEKGGRILQTNREAFDLGENTTFVGPGHNSVVEVRFRNITKL